MALIKVPRKKVVSKARQKSFWQDLAAGKKKEKPLEKYLVIGNGPKTKLRKMIRVSASTLGTIREFRSKNELQKYVKKVNAINALFAGFQTGKFVFLPAQFLSQKGSLLVERVYRAATLNDLNNAKTGSGYGRTSVFLDVFKAKMKKKKVNLRNPQHRIWRDFDALKSELKLLSRLATDKGIGFDSAWSNFLVHDYEPTTGKFLISIIDIGAA